MFPGVADTHLLLPGCQIQGPLCKTGLGLCNLPGSAPFLLLTQCHTHGCRDGGKKSCFSPTGSHGKFSQNTQIAAESSEKIHGSVHFCFLAPRASKIPDFLWSESHCREHLTQVQRNLKGWPQVRTWLLTNPTAWSTVRKSFQQRMTQIWAGDEL